MRKDISLIGETYKPSLRKPASEISSVNCKPDYFSIFCELRASISAPINNYDEAVKMTVKEILVFLKIPVCKKSLNYAAAYLRDIGVKTVKSNGIRKRIILIR